MPDTEVMKYATAGERTQAEKLVKAALAAGYTVSLRGVEEWTVRRSTDVDAILAAMATTEADTLRFRDAVLGESLGWVELIYGNAEDGSELFADHTDNEAMRDLVGPLEME